MISAKAICDSTSWLNKRLTTFVLEYPRYLHSELLTHRVFSKNSASSRAIPFSKFVKMVQDDPAMPLWTENMKGMQGPVFDKEMHSNRISNINLEWLAARDEVIKYAHSIADYEVHKQNVNRLLEPWMHIKIVLTGTEFTSFFELRDHHKAHPEIQLLARSMKEAMSMNIPKMLQPGEWHIPFGGNMPPTIDPEGTDKEKEEYHSFVLSNSLKVSAARCARVSYNNFEGTSDIAKDIELFDRLFSESPQHCSPAEHQARVPTPEELNKHFKSEWVQTEGFRIEMGKKVGEVHQEVKHRIGKYVSNLNGWIQLRKLIECGEFK